MSTTPRVADDSPDFSGQRIGADALHVLVERDEDGRPHLSNLNLSRAVVEGDLDLRGVAFTGAASFDEAEFLGAVDLTDATFSGTTRFDRARFRSGVELTGARFEGTLWFNQATANGRVSFAAALVEGDGTFDGTVFGGPATFSVARFHGDLSCDMVRFAERVLLDGAHMRRAASFERAQFTAGLDISGTVVEGRASFRNARLQGDLNTEGARFELNPEFPAALEELSQEVSPDVVPRAASDLPSAEDLLGFAPVAGALQALLDDRNTTLPISIAVTAPWGGGKSSAMVQLRALLTDPPAGYRPTRRWRTVWFDAWRYERAERLWAALAKEIYAQPLSRMGRWERLQFRTRLERRRLGGWKFAGKLVWPPVAVAAAVTALLAADVGQGGTAAAVLSAAAAGFGGILHYGDAIRDPFKRAMERYASRPDYEAQLGFTSEAESDIKNLMSLLCSHDDDALAIFVDDLDRCSSAHVVEIVEAMNQVFAASAEHRCAFILGLDHEVVATSIEVAYRDTVQGLRDRGSPLGGSYGPQFLAKLVQVTVTLPRARATDLRRLLDVVPPPTATAPAADAVERARSAVVAAGSGPEGLDGAADQLADAGVAPEVVEQARRYARVEQLRDSDDVLAVVRDAVDFLEPNPRQVKRFHNAFRLQLYIANEERAAGFTFTNDQLYALARWVAVRLRWPAVADLLDREPSLVDALEASANGLPPSPEHAAGRAAHPVLFQDADLRAVLTEPLPARRLSRLPPDAFLPVA